ncbi:MAG: hypothetical protein ABJE66_03660 [Deltaproteobacteria bacterium]
MSPWRRPCDQTATSTRLTMPPPLFRLPNDADRAAMIAELRK